MKITLAICAMLFAVSTAAFAGKSAPAKGSAQQRATTKAKAESILNNKGQSVERSKRGGVKLGGSDARYQGNQRTGEVTRLSGGKDKNGRYKNSVTN